MRIFSLVLIGTLLLDSLNFSSLKAMDDEPDGDSPPSTRPASLKEEKSSFSILVIEQSKNSLGIYDSVTRKESGRIHLNFYPHEIEVSPDGKRAYVSNFGFRDYDNRVGYPGNCVSVIDIEHFCEVDRLYTIFEGKKFWGPHGLRVHPNGKELYVSVECVDERYTKSNTIPKVVMLVFNLEDNSVRNLIPVPSSKGLLDHTYPVLAGTHNFIFAPPRFSKDSDKKKVSLWYYSGLNGVTCIDPENGQITKHYATTSEAPPKNNIPLLNVAVRGFDVSEDGSTLLVAAQNELAVIDTTQEPSQHSITKFGDLGVGQIFFPTLIPGTKLALAPAARENQVLVVNIDPNDKRTGKERVLKRLITGTDPLQAAMSPIKGERVAYVTNANSAWLSELHFNEAVNDFKIRHRIYTQGGGNTIAFSMFLPHPPTRVLKFGVCLPFTGDYAAEGRECRLGLQFWEDFINNAGGMVVNGQRYRIEICDSDTESKTDEVELKVVFSKFLDKHKGESRHHALQVMFGTYPPSANLVLAKLLPPTIPLITSTGRDPSLFNQGFKNVFGISPLKQGSDLKDTVQTIFKHVFPKPQTAMILSCNHGDYLADSLDLEKYLKEIGIKLLNPLAADTSSNSAIIQYSHCHTYEGFEALKELKALISKLGGLAKDHCHFYPDLLFVSGHRKEVATVINGLAKEDFSFGALSSNVGITSYHFLNKVTVPIENVMGSVCWSDRCCDFAQDRFVSSFDFYRMFDEVYSESPSEFVAGFVASGVVAETALRKTYPAQSNEGYSPESFISELSNLDFDSFYGPIMFDESGVNINKPLITVQLRSENSNLVGIPVWPSSLVNKEKPLFPVQAWKK